MSMTKKDFSVIAKALNKTKPADSDTAEKTQWELIVSQICWELNETYYPSFDPDKFFKTCRGVS